MKKNEKRYCVVCGSSFCTRRVNTYRCEECIKKGKRCANFKYCSGCGKKINRATKLNYCDKCTRNSNKERETITSIQQKAHTEHLTYGEYVAKYGL